MPFTDSSPVDLEQRRLLRILAACSFLVGLDALLVVPMLPAITTAAAVSPDRAALLVTAYALAYLLCAPLFGMLSDRWGRRPLIIAGLLLLSIGTVLTGFGTDLTSLLAMRAATGVGAAMIEPSVLALIGDRIDYRRRGQAMGMVMAAMIASTLLGVPLGSSLAQFSDWRWTFWSVGVLALVMLVPAARRLPKDALHFDTAGPGGDGQLGAALKSVPVLTSLAVTFLWYGGLQGMFANAGIFYDQYFALTTGQIGLVIMIAGAGSVLGSIIGGKLADRAGKRRVFIWAGTATAVGVYGVSQMGSDLAGAILVHVAWASCFGVGQAALSAALSELAPGRRATLLSLNSAAMFGGMTATTASSTALLSSYSFPAVGIMCAVAVLLALPLSRRLFMTANRQVDPASVEER